MNSEAIRKIQQALIHKGFAPGEADGIWGRNTVRAVKEFQRSVGLDPDGVVGPKTSSALFSASAPAPVEAALPWLTEAERLIGTREVLGPRSNPLIVQWSKALDLKYPGDDVPWCGLFVGHCIGSTMPDELLPGNPLGARQWERFGTPIAPRLGAIMVFWRISPSSGKGHVGFYTGQDPSGTAYRILGGNQKDSVCVTWIDKERFVGARWPRTAAALAPGSVIVHKNRDQELSANER